MIYRYTREVRVVAGTPTRCSSARTTFDRNLRKQASERTCDRAPKIYWLGIDSSVAGAATSTNLAPAPVPTHPIVDVRTVRDLRWQPVLYFRCASAGATLASVRGTLI
jgi:hypothetical protein